MPAPNRKPAAAADPIEGDRELAAVRREARQLAGDLPAVTGGRVSSGDRVSRAARLTAQHAAQVEGMTDRGRRMIAAEVERVEAANAAIGAIPDAPTRAALPPVGTGAAVESSGAGVIPAAVVERIDAARAAAKAAVIAAAVESGDRVRVEAARCAASFDYIPKGRRPERVEVERAYAAIRSETAVRVEADRPAERRRSRTATAAPARDRVAAMVAVEDRHRVEVERAYAAAVEAVGVEWGDPLPGRVEIDRGAWKAAGGIVETLPPVKRPKRRGAAFERRTRQTGGAIDAAFFPKGESKSGDRVTRSRVADLSPYGRATVEAVALAAVAALIDPAAPRVTTPAVTLPDRAAAELAAGRAVRMWITGLAFRDAGKVEGTDNPKRPRPAWYVPASGSGRVRVIFAVGGEITTASPLATTGAAGGIARAVLKAGAISPDTAVSVSLTGKAAARTAADH